MATTTVHNIKDLDPVLRRMDKFPKEAIDKFAAAMQWSVLVLEREVVERTPVGVGNSPTGHVRSSIASEVIRRADDLQGIVGTPAPYALFVEEDTKPHWAPKGALADWVHFVMGVAPDEVASVEYLVRKRIAGQIKGKPGGTKGKHMFAEGWKASEDRIRDRFIKTFHDAAKPKAQ